MLYKKYMLYHPGPATQILHIAGGIDLDEEQMRAVVDICIKGATGLLSVGVNPPPPGFPYYWPVSLYNTDPKNGVVQYINL